MPRLSLRTIPCLSDNYAFLIHNGDTGETCLIDAPDAAPIEAALKAEGWRLTDVILTHHHFDHVDGLPPLRDAHSPVVWGAAADAHRLPPLDKALNEGDQPVICSEQAEVFDVSGHTIGHIAIHFPESALLFTADSLMALGCGRLFEGTPAQMWDSMQKLLPLPDDTTVCSGHEYTATNAAFCQSIDPQNKALISRIETITARRAAGEPTVPSTLGEEKATNPFLRADTPELAAALNMQGATPLEVFIEARARRDKW